MSIRAASGGEAHGKIYAKIYSNKKEFLMIREVIKPDNENLTIKIPREYIGREIEYTLTPVKDYEYKDMDSDISSLGGILKKYSNSKKIKYEKDAWKLHIMDKFTI